MSLALMVGLCSMLLAGFAGAPENAEQNWKTYRSEKFGFEIAYPAGMDLKRARDGA